MLARSERFSKLSCRDGARANARSYFEHWPAIMGVLLMKDTRPSLGPHDVCATCVAAAETHIQAMFAVDADLLRCHGVPDVS